MTQRSSTRQIPEPIVEWQAQWTPQIPVLQADRDQAGLWEATPPNPTDDKVVDLIRRADVAAKALERIPLNQLRPVLENRIQETVYSGLAMSNVHSTAHGYTPEQLEAHRRYVELCTASGMDAGPFGPNAYGYEMIGRVLNACLALAKFGQETPPAQVHLRVELRPPQ